MLQVLNHTVLFTVKDELYEFCFDDRYVKTNTLTPFFSLESYNSKFIRILDYIKITRYYLSHFILVCCIKLIK